MKLVDVETKQLIQIKKYATTILEKDKTGHSMDHINRVVSNAKKIQLKEGGNPFLIVAGAYLHDVLDDKLVKNPEQSRDQLIQFLKRIELPSKEIELLLAIIDHVSFSHQLASNSKVELSIEEKIVQDADRLDAIGAIGIGRTFYYGGKKGHAMYDPTLLPRESLSKEEYRVNQTVLNHFYEKLFKLKDMMQTQTAKHMAKKRHDLMISFVENFIEEWDE